MRLILTSMLYSTPNLVKNLVCLVRAIAFKNSDFPVRLMMQCACKQQRKGRHVHGFIAGGTHFATVFA